uniref:RING-type domain-containing protein n=1 Tax=Globodera rostochiensis TaxID=31243 RepID=A0A914IAJ2_GLORO
MKIVQIKHLQLSNYPSTTSGARSSPQNVGGVELSSSSSSDANLMPSQRPKRLPIPPSIREKLETDNPLNCKICLQIFNEPYTTVCGHTFCRACIMKSLQFSTQCPVCDSGLDTKKARICGTNAANDTTLNNVLLSPNYAVAALLEQQSKPPFGRTFLDHRDRVELGSETGTIEQQQQQISADDIHTERFIINMLLSDSHLSLDSLKRIEETLRQKRVEVELNDSQMRALLLHDFLEMMIEKRDQTVKQVQAELELLKQDRQKVLASLSDQICASPLHRLVPDSSTSGSASTSATSDQPKLQQIADSEESIKTTASTSTAIGVGMHKVQTVPDRMSQLRHRMLRHGPSLEAAYLSQRLPTSGQKDLEMQSVGAVATTDGLNDFSLLLKNMYRYGDVKVLTTLNYNIESYNQPSIVSSIEFDKDGDFFVIAGVTKMIKLYDFNALMDHCCSTGDAEEAGIATNTAPSFLHQPVVQLRCNSKISNVSWNPYNKQMLASSDYDGTVQLWDTASAKCTRTFDEHEKRCWTVQFNSIDPHLMASGSDDGKVKLWSVMCPQSLCAIDAKVNVCCVYFSPKSRDQLVFGSSDHCVHLYDLRQMAKPLNIFRGHRKAVSYVKYVNENEVISASTDSNLRLWDVNTGKCLQIMRGHQNEKNFVGLATDGTHVICGSENNQLYLYYKAIDEPMLSFDFGQRCVIYPASQQPNNNNAPSSALPASLASASNASELLGTTDFLPAAAGNAHGISSGAASWQSLFGDFYGTVGGGTTSSSSTPNAGSNTGDFVSAVCWKRNSNIVLAANSQGQTFVLRLE